MATQDVLEYLRQRDPKFRDVPDENLIGYVRARMPDLAENLDHIDVVRSQPKLSAFQRVAASRLRGIQMQQSAAEEEQTRKDAYGRAAGIAAEALPFIAAAPFTGGASLGGAVALMGAAGVAGGLMREGVKARMGSSEIPQTPEALAKTLGVDAVTGMLSEVGGRTATGILGLTGVGRTVAPKLVVRSAAKHEVGARILQNEFNATRRELGAISQNTSMDVSNSYFKFFNDIDVLPKGTGQGRLAKRLTQLTQETQGIYNDIVKDLNIVHGAPGRTQAVQLDTLVEMKGRINKIAWDKTLRRQNPGEAEALQNLAANLDKDIRAGLGTLPNSKEAVALFDGANNVLKLQRQQNVGMILTEEMLKRIAARGTIGAVGLGLGGSAYGYRKEGLTGAIKYGAEGAALGLAAGATNAAIPRASAWALDFMVHHPKTASFVKRAIDEYIKGKSEKSFQNAMGLMMRAGGVAEVRAAIKDAIQHGLGDSAFKTNPMEDPESAQR